MFATAADHIRLRRFNVDCEEDVKRVSEEDLLAWLDAMSEHCGVSVKGALKLAATGKERVHEYAVESLITAVRIADHLRNPLRIRRTTCGRWHSHHHHPG